MSETQARIALVLFCVTFIFIVMQCGCALAGHRLEPIEPAVCTSRCCCSAPSNEPKDLSRAGSAVASCEVPHE